MYVVWVNKSEKKSTLYMNSMLMFHKIDKEYLMGKLEAFYHSKMDCEERVSSGKE